MRRHLRKQFWIVISAWLGVNALWLSAPTLSRALLINFESVADNIGLGITVTNQFSAQGVTFTNATALTAGLSLNEIDFPPHSGTTVVSNINNAVLRLDFASPLLDVGGFFTYSLANPNKLLLQAFDINGILLGSRNSAFSDNTADIFGEPGSSPNEFLQLSNIGAIRRLDISGSGESFTLDDLQFTPGTIDNSRVPEPNPYFLFLIGVGCFFIYRVASRNRSPRLS